MKKLPWRSLLLLVVTYSFFGWLLFIWNWRNWIVAGIFIVLMSGALTDPWTVIKIFFSDLLQSPTLSFILIVLFSFFSVVVLHWFSVSANALILICASMLTRLDLQTSGFTRVKAFLILALLSLTGLGLGLLIHKLW